MEHALVPTLLRDRRLTVNDKLRFGSSIFYSQNDCNMVPQAIEQTHRTEVLHVPHKISENGPAAAADASCRRLSSCGTTVGIHKSQLPSRPIDIQTGVDVVCVVVPCRFGACIGDHLHQSVHER